MCKSKVMIIVYVYYYMVLFCTIPFSTVIMWGNKYGGDGRKEQLVCVHLNWTQKGRQFFKESVVHLKRRKVEGDTKLLIDLSEFRIIEQTRLPATARDDVPSEFLRLIRRKS